jgi:hypothetical protein
MRVDGTSRRARGRPRWDVVRGIYRVRAAATRRDGHGRPRAQYPGPIAGWYEGPDCPGTPAGDSLRFPCGDAQGAQPGIAGAHRLMSHPLLDRVWRACVALGPIVAIALTLAAGRRW